MVLDSVALQNNSGNGRLIESLRGNSGGVAIGYNRLPMEFVNTSLLVTNSTFRWNQALGYLSSERAVSEQSFVGRGGGIALYINESYQEINVEIADCVFENNFARLFGGGIYVVLFSYQSSQQEVTLLGNHFSQNTGLVGGGGIIVTVFSIGNISRPNSFIFKDCTFDRNVGESGGGMDLFICMLTISMLS